MTFLRRHPKLAAAAMTALSLVSAGAVVILADFGASVWVFGLLLLWPATLGLPATLALVAVASVWGRFPAGYGLLPFVAVSAVAGWLCQWAALVALNRFRRVS